MRARVSTSACTMMMDFFSNMGALVKTFTCVVGSEGMKTLFIIMRRVENIAGPSSGSGKGDRGPSQDRGSFGIPATNSSFTLR